MPDNKYTNVSTYEHIIKLRLRNKYGYMGIITLIRIRMEVTEWNLESRKFLYLPQSDLGAQFSPCPGL